MVIIAAPAQVVVRLKFNMTCLTKLNKRRLIIFLAANILVFFGIFLKPVLAQEASPFSAPVQILQNPEILNEVFILNSGSNQITVFDESERRVIANIPTGGIGSVNMRIGDSGKLYILNGESGDVTSFPPSVFTQYLTQDLINQILKERKIIPVGKGIISLAFNPGLQKIYVLSAAEEAVSVIDEKTDEVSSVIKVGRNPSGVGVMAKMNKVYVLNRGDNTLSIIDSETDKLIKTLSIGNQVYSLRITEDNKALVSSRGDDKIYVIDGRTDKLIASVESGGKGPLTMLLNDKTKKLYVSNWLDGSVGVIDTQNYKLLKKISLPEGARPGLLAIARVSNLIFVPNREINSVSIIDGEKDEIITTLKTGVNPGRPVFCNKKGVYIPNLDSNSITIISRTADGKFQAETIPEQKEIISTGKDFSYPLGLVFNERDNEVYVFNNLEKNFLILDGKTYKIKEKISVGLYPRAILFVPELNKIFVSNGGGDNITIYNFKDKSQKTVDVGKGPIDLLFNSPVKKLYVLNYNSNELSVIDAGKENLLNTIPLEGMPGAITLNSKENKIYIAGLANNEVIIIDGNTDEVLERIKVGLRPSKLLYDEKFNRIYVANSASNDLTVIDGTTNQIIKTLKLNNPLANLVSDPEKNRIYGTNPNENAITVIDSENLEIISPDIRVAGNPLGIIFDSPKSRLFTMSPRGFLTVVDLKSSECPKFLNVIEAAISLADVRGAIMTDMTFSPKTEKLFVSLDGANALAVIDVKNNEPKLEAVVSNKGVTWAAPLPQGEMTWSQKLLEFLKQNITYILAGIILLIIIIYFVIRRIKTLPKSTSL